MGFAALYRSYRRQEWDTFLGRVLIKQLTADVPLNSAEKSDRLPRSLKGQQRSPPRGLMSGAAFELSKAFLGSASGRLYRFCIGGSMSEGW
jgi:hypothetical protein